MQGNGVFNATFKVENCLSLKFKLSKAEPTVDPYNPVSDFKFRDTYPDEKKPLFKVINLSIFYID
jgi:hypothetical protein